MLHTHMVLFGIQMPIIIHLQKSNECDDKIYAQRLFKFIGNVGIELEKGLTFEGLLQIV